jgi:DnaK suppressor protein
VSTAAQKKVAAKKKSAPAKKAPASKKPAAARKMAAAAPKTTARAAAARKQAAPARKAASGKPGAVKAAAVKKPAAPAPKVPDRKPPAAQTPAASGCPKAPAAPKTRVKAKPVAAAPAGRGAVSVNPRKVLPMPIAPVAPAPRAFKKVPRLANNWKTKPAEELTDAEVLSMPDAEYMNEAQLAFFRHRLIRLQQDILANAGETTEHLREETVVVPDPADRATIEEEHALELRTRDRERKLLKKIEQSIARIDAGDYGYCDETGEPIGVGRLLARPTATLSLEAQQRRELKQKMFGD